MSKYIDAEKLIAEIERQIKEVNIQCQKSRKPQFTLYGKINGLEQTINLIRSFQQEQPEVDLEKELDRYLRGEFQQTAGGNFNNYIQVARHFYELGLNARKE